MAVNSGSYTRGQPILRLSRSCSTGVLESATQLNEGQDIEQWPWPLILGLNFRHYHNFGSEDLNGRMVSALENPSKTFGLPKSRIYWGTSTYFCVFKLKTLSLAAWLPDKTFLHGPDPLTL